MRLSSLENQHNESLVGLNTDLAGTCPSTRPPGQTGGVPTGCVECGSPALCSTTLISANRRRRC